MKVKDWDNYYVKHYNGDQILKEEITSTDFVVSCLMQGALVGSQLAFVGFATYLHPRFQPNRIKQEIAEGIASAVSGLVFALGYALYEEVKYDREMHAYALEKDKTGKFKIFLTLNEATKPDPKPPRPPKPNLIKDWKDHMTLLAPYGWGDRFTYLKREFTTQWESTVKAVGISYIVFLCLPKLPPRTPTWFVSCVTGYGSTMLHNQARTIPTRLAQDVTSVSYDSFVRPNFTPEKIHTLWDKAQVLLFPLPDHPDEDGKESALSKVD